MITKMQSFARVLSDAQLDNYSIVRLCIGNTKH
jgi:hypothetical protein